MKYEGQLLEKILIVLNNTKTIDDINELTRAQLVNDIFNLARSDHINYKEALRFLEYLKNEKSYFPWSSAYAGFRFLMQRYAEDNNIGKSLRVSAYLFYLYINSNNLFIEIYKFYEYWLIICSS